MQTTQSPLESKNFEDLLWNQKLQTLCGNQ